MDRVEVTQEDRDAAAARLAKVATEKRFECRLATEDQRNGYEVGWAEGYLAALSILPEPSGEVVEAVKVALSPLVNEDMDPAMRDAWLTDPATAAIAALASRPSADEKAIERVARAIASHCDITPYDRLGAQDQRHYLETAQDVVASLRGTLP